MGFQNQSILVVGTLMLHKILYQGSRRTLLYTGMPRPVNDDSALSVMWLHQARDVTRPIARCSCRGPASLFLVTTVLWLTLIILQETLGTFRIKCQSHGSTFSIHQANEWRPHVFHVCKDAEPAVLHATSRGRSTAGSLLYGICVLLLLILREGTCQHLPILGFVLMFFPCLHFRRIKDNIRTPHILSAGIRRWAPYRLTQNSCRL